MEPRPSGIGAKAPEGPEIRREKGEGEGTGVRRLILARGRPKWKAAGVATRRASSRRAGTLVEDDSWHPERATSSKNSVRPDAFRVPASPWIVKPGLATDVTQSGVCRRPEDAIGPRPGGYRLPAARPRAPGPRGPGFRAEPGRP